MAEIAEIANLAKTATITHDLVIIVCAMVLLWHYVGCQMSATIKQSMNNNL